MKLSHEILLVLAVIEKTGTKVTLGGSENIVWPESSQELRSRKYNGLEPWQAKKKTPWRKRK